MPRFLVVPIDVAALVVTPQPQPSGTGFAPPLIQFGNLPWGGSVNAAPFLSETALAGPFEAEQAPTEASVQVHWAMPDALTRATRPVDQNGKEIVGSSPQFPNLPDMWLVTRIARTSDPSKGVRSWVVDSRYVDTLSESKRFNHGSSAVPWPVPDDPSAPDQPFRYLGRTIPLDSWSDFASPGDLHADVLDATSFGSIELAAYYPNTVNVFGVNDPLDDGGLDTTQKIELCYVVVGWHRHPADDPVASQDPKKLSDVLQRLKWQVEDPGALAGTVYCGMVHSVGFDPALAPAASRPLQATIGNTSNEAVSALFVKAGQAPADPDGLEFDLHTFLTGQLAVLADNAGPLLVKRQLHRQRFSPLAAGNTWYVRQRSDRADMTAAQPAATRALLDALNHEQAALDALMNGIRGKQWQLFADWYKYLVALHPQGAVTTNPLNVFAADIAAFMKGESNDKIPANPNGPLPDLEKDIASVPATQAAVDTARNNVLAAKLPEGMELAKKPSDFFWQPSDPALLLHGDDVVPALRYGGDGLYRADGTLACRTSDRLVTQVAAPAGAVAGSPALTLDRAVFPGFGPGATTSVLDLPSGMDDLIAALVLESLLLWPGWAAAKAAEKFGQDPAPWLKWLTTQQDGFLAGGGTVASPYDGVPPSPVGIDAWDGNPWLPIMMHWEITYWPAQQTPHDDPKQVFDPKLIVGRLHEENDSLDTDGVELVLAGDAPATQTTYSGITFITPHAGFAAVKQLQKYAQDNASSDSALVKLAANVKPVPLLSQALNGFHDRFLLRRKTPQVAVRDPFAQDAAFVKRVRRAVEALDSRVHTAAPIVEDSFCPVRAGLLQLTRLRLVDAFGQYREYSFEADPHALRPSRSVSPVRMFATPTQAPAFMPPRISQPALLEFRWLAADDSNAVTGSHSSASPICGWLAPNYLDDSLMVYDASGVALGSVAIVDKKTTCLGAPTSMATFGKRDGAVVADANPHLAGFVQSLLDKTSDGLNAFLNSINDASALVQPLHHPQSAQFSILAGQPLALVRATLTLKLMAPPAINNTWQAFVQDMQAGSRTTNGHEHIEFPVLLGSAQDPDDGLAGFYVGPSYDTFHTVVPKTYAGIPTRTIDTVTVSAAGAPVTVTMLIDPRCPVHATTGYMPVQSLQIPTETFRDAFAAMGVTFLTAPLLTGPAPDTAGQVALPLPLPGVARGAWSWVSVTLTAGTRNSLTRDAVPLKARPPFGATAYRLEDGWLLLQGAESGQ
jgi:hypothetical protein